MKKKLISLLLVLCMTVALFTCLGTSAFAEDDTFKYTIKSGDTLWGLCNAKGLNYYTCKNAIMKLNGFTSEYKLSHISVGDTITLPSSDAVAQTLAASGSTTTSTTTTVSGSTTTSTTTTTNALANGDIVSYYLIAHTMASGENVMGIYNGWGLNYKTYSDQILAVNNLKGFNKMYAGKTYLFPAPSVPSGSTAAYSIIAHKVVSGDSAYNLCNTYNTNYNKSLTVVKSVNGGKDLTSIKTGQVIYIPASGTVSIPTNGGGTSGSGTNGSTSGGTVVGTTAYEIKKTAAKNGSFLTKIGSNEVTTAKSGESVIIVTTPAAGYVVDSIVVSKADDASTTVATNSSVFKMPAYAVNVKVTFKLASTITSGVAHKITISATNGTAKAIADGAELTTAKAGSFITVVPTANRGYELESVKVTYNNYASNVPVSSNAFNMPDYDVNVVVTFKAVPTYNIALVSNPAEGPGCTFSTSVNGTNTTKAMAGETVTINANPASGYSVDSIDVTYDSGKALSMINAYSFVMPAEGVRVHVVFKTSYGITSSVSNGSVSYQVDGVAASRATSGKVVTVIPKANNGYVVTGVTAKAGTTDVPCTKSGDNYTFTMPAGAVTVTVATAKVATYALTADPAGSLKFMVNGGYVTSAAEGATVTVVAGSLADGKKLGTLSSADCTIDTTNNTFKMPAKAVTVSANLADIAVRTISVNFNDKVSKLSLIVDGKAVSPATTSSVQNTYSILEGKRVTVEASCVDGYAISEITSEQVSVSDADIFVVGATDAVINVQTRGQYRSIMSSQPANGSFTLVDADGHTVTNTAAAGVTVYVRPVADKNYELDKITYAYLENGKTVTRDISSGLNFVMPGADVTLTVTFKAVLRSIKAATLVAPESATGLGLNLEINNVKIASYPKADVPAGTVVEIVPVITVSGYSVSDVQILDADGTTSIKNKVDYNSENNTFKMPADYNNITVKVTMVKDA